MKQPLWIVLFGIGGVLARWGLDLTLKPLMPVELPYATLIINILGSFAAGGVFYLMQNAAPSVVLSAFLIGGLGGFTTFSAFAIQSLELIQNGFVLRAILYGMVSWMGTLIAAWGGFSALRALS